MPPVNDSARSPVVFADTGVQIICKPLRPDMLFLPSEVGPGWQYCSCKVGDQTKDFPFVQWQIDRNRLFLAIDTTIGPEDSAGGHFCKASALSGDFAVKIEGLVGLKGEPLAGLPSVDFIIRPATAEAGDAMEVHMVVDFGNSRTGALLVEFRGDAVQEPQMTPLQLFNRFHLDAWDAKGALVNDPNSWWFSSKSQWCTTPYLPPKNIETTVYKEKERKGLFGAKMERAAVTVSSTPDTFQDISMIRMGREADDLTMALRTEGEVRIGVSSPKRYLWAKDASWLGGANWFMADPFDRHGGSSHACTLKGPLLKFISENDADDDPAPRWEQAPAKPRHAPRTLMIGSLYEMLCQAFGFINSSGYRERAGEAGRKRILRTMTLTYPSGMIAAEREQLRKQAHKAIRIFAQTMGKTQHIEPELKLSIDEASAVHLTYIWSEVRKLGRNPRLWFSLMGRKTPPSTPDPIATAVAEPATKVGAARPRPAGRASQSPAEKNDSPKLRIACVDIGGGTSDLMIAEYQCETMSGGDRIVGQMLHLDGISLAGDHLVKRLLECIIIPQFAEAVNLEASDVNTLFGPEVGANRSYSAQRINWINQLFVPLAQAYLTNAVTESDANISHFGPDSPVAEDVVTSLQDALDQRWGRGQIAVRQELRLRYDAEDFRKVVDEVFEDLAFDFCRSIVHHKADVVLLAGQPTKLRYIRQLFETYLPLSASRIVPMYDRYVGAWYPYQDPENLNTGVIVDPKSAVVVGAAIDFSAKHGKLPQFHFKMSDKPAQHSYFWGVITESRIPKERLLFKERPADGHKGEERTVMHLAHEKLMIGRKRLIDGNAQASPVYLLSVVRRRPLGEIDVTLTLERRKNAAGEEELAVIPESVLGAIDGESAVFGQNVLFDWRTLLDERYYLDTGGLDRIEIR